MLKARQGATKDSLMQVDLHDFLTRFIRTVVMTLVPVAMLVFFTMPASMHHHIGAPTSVAEEAPQHMT